MEAGTNNIHRALVWLGMPGVLQLLERREGVWVAWVLGLSSATRKATARWVQDPAMNALGERTLPQMLLGK